MKRKLSTDAKVGLFVIFILALIAYITIDVSNMSLTPGGTYTVYTILDNAEGVTNKTPVQIAGIPIGAVQSIELLDGRRARLSLKIKKGVKVTGDMEVEVRVRGVLGDTYLELIPGREQAPVMKEGEYLTRTQRATDYQDVFRSVGEITEDLKVITSDLKTYTHTDQSVVAKILTNMEVLTANMATFSEKNAKNMDAVVSNLAALTADLRHLSSEGGEDLEVALQRISEITGKVNEGQGTIGRLINDDSTVEKTNEVLDNLSDVTRTYFGMQAVLGYHLEYLGEAGSAKNYFSIQLKPRPDKYFEFGVVYNPNPPGSTSTSTEVIETNGVTTTINRETTDFSKVRFNALLAKQFDDFTVKGGLIESTGGVGVDYERGPAALRFDAYDFGDGNAHLKAMAELNVTPAFYILGGADDLTGKQRRDYFFGAGLRFGDEDIKSLLGGAALFLSR